jgi:pyruvate formate lyase activating enzyme
MSFYKITYNEKYRFATLHNYGCTFSCPICSYKLRSGAGGRPGFAYPPPQGKLSVEMIRDTLDGLDVDVVYFMGGEPTVAKELPEILDFVKNEMRVRTCLGHTNGSNLSLPFLDSANVGLKAWDEKVHLDYTGREKSLIFDNFAAAFARGIELKANVVYVPTLVDIDQIEQIAIWLSSLSSDIPFHIMSYIPVPGQNFPAPRLEQVEDIVDVCGRYLKSVKRSFLSPEQALSLSSRDDRFDVKEVALAC